MRKGRFNSLNLNQNHYLVLAVIFLVSMYLVGSVHAGDDLHQYFIDEPVFGGKSRIIEAGRENKELIVLVHGLGDRAADTWKSTIPQLSKKYHVLAFDLPGFGQSSKSNQLYSPDNYVAFIQYVVRQSGHESLLLMGHSMGGNIALRYAATYPDKVKRLMLIDTAGVLHRITFANYLTHFGVKLMPQLNTQQGEGIRSLAGALLGELARRHNYFEMGEQMVLNDPALRQNVLGGNPSTIAAYAMSMTDFSASLSSMKVPTLILWGEKDEVTPIRTAKVLATNLKNSGLVIIGGAGHIPMTDKPREFNWWLTKFVSGTDAEFNNVLKQQQYKINTEQPISSKRIASCKNNSQTLFRGDYRLITIENCRGVEIDSARIQSLTIRNSQVTMNNSYISSPGKAMLAINSDIEINGCKINGQPAIEFKKTPMDIAGSWLSSAGTALKNTDAPPSERRPRPGPIPGFDENETTLMFSVSHLNSKYFDKKLHGPVNFLPEQAW